MNVQPTLRDASYLDLIFSGRNKAYGGYELRKHYPRRITKAAAWMLGGVLCLSATFAFRAQDKPTADVGKPFIITADLHPIEPGHKPKPEQPKPTAKAQPAPAPAFAPTMAFTTPVVAPDNEVVTPPPPVDSLEGRTAGLVSTPGNEGQAPGDGRPPGAGDGTGDDDSTGVGSGPVARNEPFTSVEFMPQFNGDINAYLGRNVRYPESAREAGTEGKSIIRFVVNEDGAISDVEVVRSADPSLDAEAARVIRAMPAWKPGFQNGVAVKVYFTIPVRFQLD